MSPPRVLRQDEDGKFHAIDVERQPKELNFDEFNLPPELEPGAGEQPFVDLNRGHLIRHGGSYDEDAEARDVEEIRVTRGSWAGGWTISVSVGRIPHQETIKKKSDGDEPTS